MNDIDIAVLNILAEHLAAVHATGAPWRLVDAYSDLAAGVAWRYSRRRKDSRRPASMRRKSQRTFLVARRVADSLVDCGVEAVEQIGHRMLYMLDHSVLSSTTNAVQNQLTPPSPGCGACAPVDPVSNSSSGVAAVYPACRAAGG